MKKERYGQLPIDTRVDKDAVRWLRKSQVGMKHIIGIDTKRTLAKSRENEMSESQEDVIPPASGHLAYDDIKEAMMKDFFRKKEKWYVTKYLAPLVSE